MNEEVKQESENGPGLKDAFFRVSEAFLLVSKELFGSLDDLDWATVKHKYEEITVAAKEKRELDIYSRAQHSGARDDRETRDRKDRDDRTRTLTWLLDNDRAYRALHEEIMAHLPEVEDLLDDNQEKLDAAVDRQKKALREHLERHAARLPDGRFAFKGKDKHGNDVIVDENFNPVTPEEAEGVDFTDKMTLDDYRERKKPLNDAIEIAEQNRRDQVRVGEIRERNTDNENPLSTEQKQADKAELGEIKERALERQQELSTVKVVGVSDAPTIESEEPAPSASASMAKPQI